MTGFVYPNEGIVQWDLLITVYPFITGLVAGAFIVSSLYHVFGVTRLKPVARFSLITALAFLLAAPLPLIIHLGHPERGIEMFMTPNLTSAMSLFGYIWLFYLILVLAEVWLVFRPDIVQYAHTSRGIRRQVYSALALGVYEISEKTAAIDKKLIKVLAFLGIPSAFLLHGYVGFIFGAIKANPWWSTPLMPIIFLLSAIVSGIALLIVLYYAAMKLRKTPIDPECLRSLVFWLGGFLTLDIVIEGLEIFSMSYESEESWGIISQLISQKMAVSYIGVQYVIGALLPLLVLAAVALLNLKARTRTFLSLLASVMVLTGVFAMRWNVVIGGQVLSKSMRGFIEFTPPLLGEGSILIAGAILLVPFILLAVMMAVIPPWTENRPASLQKAYPR